MKQNKDMAATATPSTALTLAVTSLRPHAAASAAQSQVLRITALEETRDALRTRAERAEADLDAVRGDNKRLAEKLAAAASANVNAAPTGTTASRSRTAARTKKTTPAAHPEA